MNTGRVITTPRLTAPSLIACHPMGALSIARVGDFIMDIGIMVVSILTIALMSTRAAVQDLVDVNTTLLLTTKIAKHRCANGGENAGGGPAPPLLGLPSISP